MGDYSGRIGKKEEMAEWFPKKGESEKNNNGKIISRY